MIVKKFLIAGGNSTALVYVVLMQIKIKPQKNFSKMLSKSVSFPQKRHSLK